LIEHGFTSAPTQDGYTADGFYRSDDPTNSVKALKPLMSQTTLFNNYYSYSAADCYVTRSQLTARKLYKLRQDKK